MAAHGYWDRTLLDRIASIGADPMDPPELAIQKRSLAISTTLSSTIACVWVGSYWAMGLIITAAVPLIYQVVSVINLVIFSRTRRFRFFRRWEHTAGLLFPFAMHLSLGGFIPSSGLVIWSFTAPVGAMLFSGRRAGAYWFIAFLLIILLAALLDPLIPNKTTRSPSGCSSCSSVSTSRAYRWSATCRCSISFASASVSLRNWQPSGSAPNAS